MRLSIIKQVNVMTILTSAYYRYGTKITVIISSIKGNDKAAVIFYAGRFDNVDYKTEGTYCLTYTADDDS